MHKYLTLVGVPLDMQFRYPRELEKSATSQASILPNSQNEALRHLPGVSLQTKANLYEKMSSSYLSSTEQNPI